MCGLPVNLSYDERVQLEFNLSRIRWLKIDDLIQALRIAGGRLAPIEYYEALAGDRKSASDMLGMATLSQMMSGR